MMFSTQTYTLCLLLMSHLSMIRCGCRQSFVTICDTFDDFLQYPHTESLSEVIIGSELKPNLTSVHLMESLSLASYHKLSSLKILQTINHLGKTYAFECSYTSSPLKYFSLWGNDLKTIEEYHFPVFAMKKFSLVNNKIDAVKGGAFTHHEVENIDLSDNLMEVVESKALPSTKSTKIITIRNNKLTHIQPESFPNGLESLNLDGNNLRYIQNEALHNLINLKELTLSRNKFGQIPQISHMKQLVIFDISSNEISTITENPFKDLNNLKLLDLSKNSISNRLILRELNVPGKQPDLTISLALNRLRNLEVDADVLQQKKLVLYGNPWDCELWTNLREKLSGHESECDLKFHSTGDIPYCVNYSAGGYSFVSLYELDVDTFRDAVAKKVNSSKCVLEPKRYQWLYPIGFGCVA